MNTSTFTLILRLPALISLAPLIAVPLAANPSNPSTRGNPRVMQGPMIGAVTPTEALIWARLSGPYTFVLSYGEDPNASLFREAPHMKARFEDDYTIVLRLTGLKADTAYHYTFRVEDREDFGPVYRFRTAPEGPSRFTVAFASCAKVEFDRIQTIWSHVVAMQPDLFFWLGDNVYADTLQPSILAEENRRQRDVPFLQPLLRSTPHLALWDDHDYGLNDSDRTNPIRGESLQVFKHYWANPSYGLPDVPGVFFKYNYGGVDFFFLDIRYYRDPNLDPDTPSKTMLGARQMAWLQRELKASDAAFKVLVSGSGWTILKGIGSDAWASFLHERNRLFDFIRDENINGVFLVSGDVHRGEANAIPRGDAGGYDLVEFVSSPIAQRTTTGDRISTKEISLRVPYARTTNFGFLRFDMSADDPAVTFELISNYGHSVYEPVRLRASQLRGQNNFARDLMDNRAQQMYEGLDY